MESQKRQGAEYEFYGKLPLKKAIPLGLQHVLAMFVGNLTPILIISGACGIAGEEFGSLQVDLLQNAMLIAGIVTLIQLFAIGWWKGADHYGNQFRVYRCVQQCGSGDGRRYPRVWSHYVRIRHWRSV